MVGILDAVRRALPAPVRQLLSRSLYPFRQGSRLFKPYLIKSKEMEGVVFDFWIGDRQGRDWYDRPCINNPVWLEMRFMRDMLVEKGDVVFECGGHHGCSTILLSSWVGDTGKVVTFEPDPANCRIIEKNIELNGLQNVLLQKAAVGAKPGTITFDAATNAVNLSGRGVDVQVRCLDELEHLNPTLLKIDVEGFEVQVLQGAKKILSRRPKLEIEVHTELLRQFGTSVEELLGLINVEDYKVWIQWRDDQQPEEYDPTMPIEKRCHLFCVSRQVSS